jgi:hypothetical protein
VGTNKPVLITVVYISCSLDGQPAPNNVIDLQDSKADTESEFILRLTKSMVGSGGHCCCGILMYIAVTTKANLWNNNCVSCLSFLSLLFFFFFCDAPVSLIFSLIKCYQKKCSRKHNKYVDVMCSLHSSNKLKYHMSWKCVDPMLSMRSYHQTDSRVNFLLRDTSKLGSTDIRVRSNHWIALVHEPAITTFHFTANMGA